MSELDGLLSKASADIDRLVGRVKVENPEMAPEERAQVAWIEWVQSFNLFMAKLTEVVSQETLEEIHRAVLRLGIDKILKPISESRRRTSEKPTTHA